MANAPGKAPFDFDLPHAACVLPSGLAGHVPALLVLDSVCRGPCMVPPSQLAVVTRFPKDQDSSGRPLEGPGPKEKPFVTAPGFVWLGLGPQGLKSEKDPYFVELSISTVKACSL